MPYVKRITKAGKTIEVEYFYTSRYQKKGIKKSEKIKPTREEQKKVNSRIAERNLRIILNANFRYGDHHIDMGYIRKRGQEYRTKEQMRKDLDVFLRELRKEYRKEGIELKYVHVMEIGEKGSRHHHLVINQGVSTQAIQRCWNKAYEGNSFIYFSPLDKSGQYKKLAAYFIKYSDKTVGTENALQGKRWNSSKNLIRPEPEYEIVTHRNWFRCEAKPYKGYYLDDETIQRGIHSPEYYGYGWFRYTMVRRE